MKGVLPLEEKKTGYKWLRNIFIMILCIAVNYAGRTITDKYSLPGWFDSYGTFFAAYLFGPVSGAIVGVTGNIIFAFWMPITLIFSTVSIFIGVSVGIFARKGYFNTLFQSMTVAGFVAVGAVVMSSVIDFIVYDGGLGNIWGDGVKDYLIENGVPKIFAVLVGELYLEFPDKLLTVIIIYLALKFTKWLRKPREKDVEEELSEIKPLAVLAAVVLMFTQLESLPASAEEVKEEEHVSYIQTVYNGENNLPCGHANAIVQTNDGILWIGTYAGLYRYNGREFRHMAEFTDVRNVNCLYVDKEGRLWIGTNDNGVAIVIGGKVTNVFNTKNGLPFNSIRAITQSASGEYYIGAANGVAKVKLRKGMELSSYIPEAGYVSRLTSDTVGNVMAVNSNGQLYLFSPDGTTNHMAITLGSGRLSCCNFAEDNSLYLGTTEGEVIRYTLRGKTMSRENTIRCSGMTKINNICPDLSDDIWICSDSGIGYIRGSEGFVKQETGNFDHSVENMEMDYLGNLWFASSRLGLLRLSRSPITDIFADTGIEACVVNSTSLYNGLLYIGSDNGLIIADTNAHTTEENELTAMLEGSRIRCLMPDSKGRLWICSYGAGLLLLNKDGSIENYSEKFPNIGTRVRMCAELSEGSVAVSAADGLYFFKDGDQTGHIYYSDEFGHSQVLCLYETKDGILYAGTDGDGIAVIQKDKLTGRITRDNGLTSDVILRLVDDPLGNGGIGVITSNSFGYLENGTVRQLTAFPYSNNYDAYFDSDGEVFVTGSAGVYVVDRQQLMNGELTDISLLNSKFGLIGSLTANAWNAVDDNKDVYLSADRGVFRINLDNYKLKNRAFRLSIPQVKIDDVPRVIERGTQFSIARDTVKIEFCAEVINYTHDDPTVSYYLEGFDQDWKEVPQSELLWVPYTNLSPGEYVFHLAIRDDNGNILEESSYSFRKEKAIYDNAWFKYYMIVVAVMFIGWLSWFFTRRRTQRIFQLQQAKLDIALNQLKMGNETILAIAKTVDAKDVRTSKHSQRVSEYSAMIAKEYGFTEAEQDNLRKAALLHDIGKIGIPDSVLNKPSRLTDEEYAVMKTHVTRGANILKDFTLIEHVVEGARYHHERYDGKGYPDGLKGEEIPLYGRIIAVADAFDAMTANRIYRKRQDFDYVMGELHKGRGTQFDPELLDIFLKLIEDKKIDIDALYQSAPSPEEEV